MLSLLGTSTVRCTNSLTLLKQTSNASHSYFKLSLGFRWFEYSLYAFSYEPAVENVSSGLLFHYKPDINWFQEKYDFSGSTMQKYF